MQLCLDDGHGTAREGGHGHRGHGIAENRGLLVKARLSKREWVLTWTVDTAAEKAAGSEKDVDLTLLLFAIGNQH